VTLRRRVVLSAGLAATATALTGCGPAGKPAAGAVWAEPVASAEPLNVAGAADRTAQPVTPAAPSSISASSARPAYATKVRSTLT
jgi:hypothetical protein